MDVRPKTVDHTELHADCDVVPNEIWAASWRVVHLEYAALLFIERPLDFRGGHDRPSITLRAMLRSARHTTWG